MSKSPITCHVLDSSTGKPAEGVQVRLQKHHSVGKDALVFEPLASGVTNSDGRCLTLLPPRNSSDVDPSSVQPGLYKVVFKTKEYFESSGRKCFYPWVEITFELSDVDEHYHIPLLISPYSYTTYRGS